MFTIVDLLAFNAARTPENTAVIDGLRRISYGELLDRARRCANLLVRRIDANDRIVILLPRGIDALALYFGAHLAGAVPVFVYEQLGARQVAQIVHQSGARLICTAARQWHVLRRVDLSESAIVDVATIRESPLATAVPRIGRDIAGLIYTSGSTGTAKGVVVTHENLLAGATIVQDYLHLTKQDRILAILPWAFDYGLNQVLAAFSAGATVVIQRSSFCPDICRTLVAAGVTGLAGVPSLWAILTTPGSTFSQTPLPALRYITNSGGALAPATITQIRTAQPQVDVYLMYGLTEAFRSTYLEPSQIEDRPTSIGKAIPNTEILVVDDQGRVCPPGVVGELIHRGPTVALGYWQDPSGTAAVFRAHPQPLAGVPTETVVYSGDFVRADSEGYLYYLGRRDELFKSRGVRVTTTEIETELRGSGMVSEAVVAAVATDGPDPRIVAAVILGGRGATLDDLYAYCRRELPQHMRPNSIVVTETMPRTSSGKTARAEVRAKLSEIAATATGQR